MLPLRKWYSYLAQYRANCSLYIQLIMFNFNTRFRTSAAVRSISANPVMGTCTVTYKDGSVYDYARVSRRAITNLLLNDNMSYGFWVNENLLCCDSKAVVVNQGGEFYAAA